MSSILDTLNKLQDCRNQIDQVRVLTRSGTSDEDDRYHAYRMETSHKYWKLIQEYGHIFVPVMEIAGYKVQIHGDGMTILW